MELHCKDRIFSFHSAYLQLLFRCAWAYMGSNTEAYIEVGTDYLTPCGMIVMNSFHCYNTAFAIMPRSRGCEGGDAHWAWFMDAQHAAAAAGERYFLMHAHSVAPTMHCSAELRPCPCWNGNDSNHAGTSCSHQILRSTRVDLSLLSSTLGHPLHA